MGSGASTSFVGPTDHSYQADGFTPFFLIFGVDAVLPEEVSYASPESTPTMRTQQRKPYRIPSTGSTSIVERH
jgi:hypothetical protein